jgi:hypothetical protein
MARPHTNNGERWKHLKHSKMKQLLLYYCLFVFQSILFAQEIPRVGFNHMFIILRNEDFAAIRRSDFVKNKLAAFESRTTSGSNETWTGTYFYGLDNYMEFFDTAGMRNLPVGTLGIGFSVDRMKDLDLLKNALSKEYKIDTFTQSRYYDSIKITWFHSLFINDSIFDAQSSFGVWVMAYDPAYFDYNKIAYRNDWLNTYAYLQKFEEKRKEKLIKNFTGAKLSLTKYEKQYFAKYLIAIGFVQSPGFIFISPDGHFTFTLTDRTPADNITLSSLLFDTDFLGESKVILISKNVSLILEAHKGQIVFE